tara:strand:- start:861 stop:983 length:123 start_codon:yes stop_codon:yes gene_type:complete
MLETPIKGNEPNKPIANPRGNMLQKSVNSLEGFKTALNKV